MLTVVSLLGFPLISHRLMRDKREDNSPSFFNMSYTEVLVNYLKDGNTRKHGPTQTFCHKTLTKIK